ncbi:MAG: Gfo/Idh/MocA family oxidoreductase [Chromatiales bacterium]|nr:Gfo/Idh/MocA family oxidoreductase [Chromatiales bacterium]
MSESLLRVAVVGVGYLGRFHARIYRDLPDVELVGVCDRDAARAAAVAAEYGCAVIEDFRTLPGRVDAVSVVVPTTAHAEVAEPLLAAGIPVLLEKPIAPDLADADRIIAAARAGGAMLQIGHVERFNAGVMALAERIRRPRFIEAHRMGAFVDRATDVDVVTDLMIHDIDIVTALVRRPVRQIQAVGTRVLTDEVDIANARLEFEGGCVANIIASRVSESKLRRIRVFEQHHYDSLDFIEQTIDTLRVRPIDGEKWPKIERQRLDIAAVRPLDAELAAFADCVRHGRAPLVGGDQGREALRIAIEVRAEISRTLEEAE